MEDCCHEEGIDEYNARNSNCGGSDDLSDDFDRQELEWALYSQIHHEEADDSKAHSKSWLEQECHISITEDEETSKNSREITSSTPNGAQSITDSSLLSSGKSSKKKKRKTLDEDSRKTSKESKKKLKENKKKSSNKDNIINLEALLVPGPSKITSVNKKHGKTEGAELSKHGKKRKHSDNSQKSKDVHKKGEIAQVFILVSSDNSDSNESEHQTPNAVTEKDDCASSDSNSEYSFGDIHAEEKMDIQLNINNPKEDCGSDTIFDSKDITIEDIHNSLGDCDWDLIDADVWKAGPVTGRMRSRYYRSSIKCNNCNERGHLMKDCPEPKKLPVCILCGLRGHTSRACPESLCYNCNHPGHGSRNCTEPRRSRTVECRRCFARGHIATECPDIWRQFHITTEPGLMCKGSQKENKSRSCFNCTRKSHWAYECRDPMMDSWKLPVTPFVAQYEMKAAFVTTKHTKKRASDSSHETPAKHIKPSHTPTKKTPQMTSEQRPEPTSYAKDIVAKNKSTAKSRVKRIAESLYSDDFPRTPLEEYVDGNEDTPRKRLTSKQENKRKWKAWQKKRKSEDRERKLSQLQQFTSYQDECEAPSHGRHWRGDSERRHGGGSRRSRQDSAACEGSNPGGGSKQSRRGGKGEGSDTRHSDRHEYGSHNDAWDPADYRDPWDTHADRHNSEGSRRDSGRKHVHVTRRGFRMFRQ